MCMFSVYTMFAQIIHNVHHYDYDFTVFRQKSKWIKFRY